jgi:hypothetical protein
MFNIEESKHFYDKNVPKHCRKAWYLFVYKFLICVNGDLLKSLTGPQVKEQKNIFNYVSVSDEAFTRWVLEIKFQKVQHEVFNPTSEKKISKNQRDNMIANCIHQDILKYTMNV